MGLRRRVIDILLGTRWVSTVDRRLDALERADVKRTQEIAVLKRDVNLDKSLQDRVKLLEIGRAPFIRRPF